MIDDNKFAEQYITCQQDFEKVLVDAGLQGDPSMLNVAFTQGTIDDGTFYIGLGTLDQEAMVQFSVNGRAMPNLAYCLVDYIHSNWERTGEEYWHGTEYIRPRA